MNYILSCQISIESVRKIVICLLHILKTVLVYLSTIFEVFRTERTYDSAVFEVLLNIITICAFIKQ